MSYVLGVDGGNTKTDYLLCDLEGRLIANLRGGTSSHEHLGYDGAQREMDERITELLHTAGVERTEIAAAAFGLAGIDQRAQKMELTRIVREIGFEISVAMNDSFLGIKAGSETGTGVCSINGTGTAAGGIDAEGRWVQVGGYGNVVSGDEAGGSHIARLTLRAAYDAAFRFGEETVLLPRVMALFGLSDTADLHDAISIQYLMGKQISTVDLINLLFAASTEGDPVAAQVVRNIADALARSAAGCAVRLRFDGPVPLVMIGSVWAKGRHQPMIDHFVAQFENYAQKVCNPRILESPPAAGSILWALELASDRVPDAELRQRVLAETKGI